MLAKIEDGVIKEYPVSALTLRRAFPNTSFPKNIEEVDLSSFGYVAVADVPAPTIDPLTEQLSYGPPAKSGGAWIQTWVKSSLNDAQILENTTRATEQAAASARNTRNSLLTQTDYLALSDATLTDEMRTYRQALRDVPAQSGFPDNITWPTKPS